MTTVTTETPAPTPDTGPPVAPAETIPQAPPAADVVAVAALPHLGHRGSDVARTLDERIRVAQLLADSRMLPKHYWNNPGNVLAAQFAADALDIPLWTAFQHLHMVEGKVGMEASFMRALLIRAGHRYDLSSTDTEARMTIHRAGEPNPKPTVVFTLADAIQARLVRIKDGKPYARSEKDKVLPWEAYTKALLEARVTSKACRRDAPEVLAGMGYTPDELDEIAERDGRRVTAEQVPTPVHETGQTPQEATAPAQGPVEAPSGVVGEVGSPQAAYNALADVQVVEDVRVIWRQAEANDWLDERVADEPLMTHLVRAQAGLKKGKRYDIAPVPLPGAEPAATAPATPPGGEKADDAADGYADAEVVEDNFTGPPPVVDPAAGDWS